MQIGQSLRADKDASVHYWYVSFSLLLPSQAPAHIRVQSWIPLGRGAGANRATWETKSSKACCFCWVPLPQVLLGVSAAAGKWHSETFPLSKILLKFNDIVPLGRWGWSVFAQLLSAVGRMNGSLRFGWGFFSLTKLEGWGEGVYRACRCQSKWSWMDMDYFLRAVLLRKD